MEEVYRFLRLLKRHKLTLIIVPVVSLIITFFLVKNLPNSYISQAQISTGIVDETQQNLLAGGESTKSNEVNQEFANLIEMIKMKKMLDQVSYKLIIHDLSSTKPFRSLSAEIKGSGNLNPKSILSTYTAKYNKTEGLNLWDTNQAALYSILESSKYDSESLKSKLRVYRSGESDFINVEYESENPELSAFVVNALTEEFIKYYTFLIKTNQRKANDFLRVLLSEKRTAMDDKIAKLRNYKIANRVLNLDEQSSQLYTQILEFNDRKQQIVEGIAAKAGALNEIDNQFNEKDRGYLESTLTKVNLDIVNAKEDIKSLNDLYIRSDFDARYKNSIDSLQRILSAQINRSTDQFIYNPLVAKQDLVSRKLDLTVQLDLAKYSMLSMEKELGRLNNEFDALVPHEADVQSMERDVDVASKDYLEVLTKFNQSNLESTFSIKLNFVQQAMPGLAQPSKKMLLVILSGIISFVFCLVVFFIIFLADRSINTPKALADTTQIPVLGTLQRWDKPMDMEKIWHSEQSDLIMQDFKKQLRSIRFEIESGFDQKTLVITSLNQGEGKTLLALSLAYAWKVTNKRVLIIDGNFSSPVISRSASKSIYLEDYLIGTTRIESSHNPGVINVMANRGGDISLFELADEDVVKKKMDELKEHFDIIIVEASSLDKLNLAKEWILYADRLIAVFEAGQSFNDVKNQHVDYLKSLGSAFTGWIFNKASSENLS